MMPMVGFDFSPQEEKARSDIAISATEIIKDTVFFMILNSFQIFVLLCDS